MVKGSMDSSRDALCTGEVRSALWVERLKATRDHSHEDRAHGHVSRSRRGESKTSPS
jgi:hypothetical protein